MVEAYVRAASGIERVNEFAFFSHFAETSRATQWLAAVMRPRHLAAISPAMTSSDYYYGWSCEGGAWSLAFEESWPIQTIALVSARRTGDHSCEDPRRHRQNRPNIQLPSAQDLSLALARHSGGRRLVL
jgi:predicted acyl esterase